MQNKLNFSLVSVALALVLSGCGGSNTSKTTSSETTGQGSGQQTGSTDTSGSTGSTDSSGSNTSSSSDLATAFPVHTKVFGVEIRATQSTDARKVLHAANVMAQYLDNDQDGLADNPLVVEKMVENKAALIMAPTEQGLETAAANLEQSDSWQALYGDETHVEPEQGQFDASLEEVLHLITHVGYHNAYPEVFGEQVGSSVADAMDTARGGQFEQIPANYPESAWYTYNDETCDYACMVTEYIYWGLTSILGAQEQRLEEIGNEWKLNTLDKVKNQDAALYNILTNSEYGLATQLPDGDYSGFEIKLEGTVEQPTGNANSSEILQSAQAANAGHKVAFTNQAKVYMMNPDGSEVEELADGSPISGYVSWGPEAKYVYFASAKGEAESAWEAFRVNVETKELTKLSAFAQDVRSLGVSPDGKYIAMSVMSGNSNIGNNNDNLTQFHTDLYIVEMDTLEDKLTAGEQLQLSDMRALVSSPAAEQFWYEELHWNPVMPQEGEAVLAYTKTWRYDEDDVSYTHAYTIRADGSENKLLLENKDMPIWDFTGTKLTFLDLSSYDFSSSSSSQLAVSGIAEETSGAAISPDGHFIIFEVGDENRRAGMARVSTDTNNQGVVIGGVNVYEPRWSPKPVL